MTRSVLVVQGPTHRVVDAKILHLVRKLLAQQQQQQQQQSVEERYPPVAVLAESLRTQYREYQRKDWDLLVKDVEKAMEQILSGSMSASAVAATTTTTTATTITSSSPPPPPLRKRKAAEARAEKIYDQAARENDSVREKYGTGLNASLRNRYKQLSRENSLAASSHGETIPEEEVQEKNETNRQVLDTSEGLDEISTTNPSLQSTTTATTTTKLKRKKGKMRLISSGRAATTGDGLDDAMATFLAPVPRPIERYEDLGGMANVIQDIRQLVEYPLIRPELYRHLGVEPPRGVLLRGPPGTGKTHLANAVAGQLGVPYFRVSAPELVAGMSGESEGRIRNLFQSASDMAPAIIFLDELDAIAPKRSEAGSSRGMEKRMVAQLLTCMDMLSPENNRNHAAVIVLAATNRPDSMDPALRRAGRFDKEIMMGVPDEEARMKILQTMTKGIRLTGDFDVKVLAKKTPGFVGADLRSLAKEAAVLAINRIFHNVLLNHDAAPKTNREDSTSEYATVATVQPLTAEQMETLYVTMEDFLAAVPLVQPSSKREGFATVPDVNWDNIGALQSIRDELTISVLEPIRNPEKFKALGLSLPAGVLLYGPPGCGKTLLAKAIAHESGANFIAVKGPELLDKYVGESERAVRLVFERARSSSPCVVFFDELDSLVPKRGSDGGGGSGVSERVVNQLLTEMDGLESRRSVFVIAATNRPELIDPAMMRPGRLDKLLYVPLPTPEDRASILKALAKNVQIDREIVDLDVIAKSHRADGYSGADCAALLREAGLAVLKEDAALENTGGCRDDSKLRISIRHFDEAFRNVMPSVPKRDQERYDRLRDRMARARSRISPDEEKTDTPSDDVNPSTSSENKDTD